MRGIALVIIIAASVPYIFVKPHIGLLVYTWISYMAPHRMVWGFAAGLPFAFFVATVTLIAWFLSKEQKRVPLTAVTIPLIAFTVWVSLTSVFAESPDAFVKWETFMKVMLMTFMTIPLITNTKRLDALIWVIVISLGFFGVKGGLFAILTGGQHRVWGPPGSFIQANNSLAIALLMTIPLMRYLQLQARKRWLNWALAAAMLLTTAAVLASYSRGALVAAVAMGFFFWLKSKRRILIGLVMIVAVAGAIGSAPDRWFQRMETIETYEEDQSALTRLEMWRLMWSVAKDDPIFGGGFEIHTVEDIYARYDSHLPVVRSPHSAYFEVLGEHGFVGLVIYIMLFIMMWRTASWISKRTRGRDDLKWASDLAPMVQVSMIGYAVGVLFINKGYFEPYYHLASILAVSQVLVARQLGETPSNVATVPASASNATRT